MTTRPSSSFIVCALAFALVVAPTLLSHAQAPAAAPADAASTNIAPSAPAPAPAAPTMETPAASTDTNAPAAAAPQERATTYTMVQGDSLDSIAKKFGTSIHALAKLNHIPKSMYRKLRAGKVLQIPPAPSDATK